MMLLDQTVLLELLSEGVSPDVQRVKRAEESIKQWSTMRGFYGTLASIIARKDVDASVRWLAALLLKNASERYWRSFNSECALFAVFLSDTHANCVHQYHRGGRKGAYSEHSPHHAR